MSTYLAGISADHAVSTVINWYDTPVQVELDKRFPGGVNLPYGFELSWQEVDPSHSLLSFITKPGPGQKTCLIREAIASFVFSQAFFLSTTGMLHPLAALPLVILAVFVAPFPSIPIRLLLATWLGILFLALGDLLYAGVGRLLFAIPFCIATLRLPILLGRLNKVLDYQEDLMLEMVIEPLKANGVEVSRLCSLRHWTFLRGEDSVLLSIIIAPIVLELAVWFGRLDWVLLFWPLLLLGAPMASLVIFQMAAEEKALGERNVSEYWRSRAIGTGVHAGVAISSMSLLFYASMALILSLSYAQAQVYQSNPDLTLADLRLYSHSLLEIALKNGVGLSSTQAELASPSLQTGAATILMVGFLLFMKGKVLCSVLREPIAWRRAWEHLPNSAPVAKDASRLQVVTACLVFHALVAYAMGIAGSGVAVLGVLWIAGLDPGYVALSPFEWLNNTCISLLGAVFGGIVSRFAVLCAFVGSLSWLALQAITMVRQVSLVSRSFPRFLRIKRFPQDDRVVLACRTLGMPSSMVRVDERHRSWPHTEVVLPFEGFVFIRLGRSIIELLTDDELTVILAHEWGHVRLHSRRIWGLQMLSLLGISGKGYMTLLLDYLAMEIEADAFAISVTRQRNTLEGLIRRFDSIQVQVLSAEVSPHKSADTASLNGISALDQFRQAIDFYFGIELWGTRHPSMHHRIASLSIAHS